LCQLLPRLLVAGVLAAQLLLVLVVLVVVLLLVVLVVVGRLSAGVQPAQPRQVVPGGGRTVRGRGQRGHLSDLDLLLDDGVGRAPGGGGGGAGDGVEGGVGRVLGHHPATTLGQLPLSQHLISPVTFQNGRPCQPCVWVCASQCEIICSTFFMHFQQIFSPVIYFLTTKILFCFGSRIQKLMI
jgi:hypothetical protein